ncbi:MAG TPA: ABC transporter permease [Thermomicrobiales bacterium]|nr:ABC transporter permease [Thermomicrobiales bacterium]
MLAYIARRIVQMIPVLFLLTLFIFFLIRFIPGDPASAILGDRATTEMVADLRARLHLDDPLWQQYLVFMRNLLFHGDMGNSIRKGDPVIELVLHRLPPTIFVAVYASLLALVITVPLAAIAALNSNRWPDYVVRTFAMISLAMPAYWIGMMLLQFFAVKYKIFPVSGYGKGFLGHLESLFLPSLALALGIASILIRSLRNSLLETLSADYVRTARAKGLSGRGVFIWHVLRTSALSTLTILSVNFAYLIGGAAVTETIFAIPGIGSLVVSSIFNRDYPVIQGTTLFFGLLVMVISLITDVIYAMLDPRVQYR